MSIFNQAADAVLKLARKCPKCGNEQVVPASRKDESLKCRVCGADMPPKK